MNEGTKKCHCFSSFFITKLLFEKGDYKFKNVKRWLKKIRALEYENLIFPVNHGNIHWFLMFVSLKNKLLKYYDSLSGCVDQSDINNYVKGVVQCLVDLCKKHRCEGVPNEWLTSDPIVFRAECYQQPNSKLVSIAHVINVSLICL